MNDYLKLDFKFLILVFLANAVMLLFPNKGNSQTVNFNHLNVEDGLQNNIVFAVTQDQKGFMWFATMTGIDKYDGVEFTHYKVTDYQLKKSEFSMVQSILCDKRVNNY